MYIFLENLATHHLDIMFGAERVKRNFFHGYAPLLLQHFPRVRRAGFQLTSALEDLLAVKPSQEAQGWGYSNIVWRGFATGFAKVPPFTRVNFANFVTLYQSKMLNCF